MDVRTFHNDEGIQMSIFKKLFRPEPRIMREQALDIAKKLCAEKGWTFEEPIKVEESRNNFRIHPKADWRPGGPWIRINARTGELIKANQPPR